MTRVIFAALLFIAGNSYAVFHENSRGAQVHTPFRWVFADSAARMAQSVAAADTDKVAYQKSDMTTWVLRDNSPKTWVQIGHKGNEGAFPCTLRNFNGTFLNFSDTVGSVKWFIIGKVLHLRLQGFNARVIGGSLYTRSFPDSLMPDTTNEGRSPVLPFGNHSYRGGRVEFNYPLEVGAGSGHNVYFACDTTYLTTQEINYLILR